MTWRSTLSRLHRKSRCHHERRNSPSVTARRPTSSCFWMTRSISPSSTALSSSAEISPLARFARASFRAGGRSRLPTWSARKGGRVRCTFLILFGGRERCLLLLQHEVVLHLVELRVDGLAVRRLAGRPLDELDDQRRLHAVDHVVVDVLVALLEQVRDHAVIAGRGDCEMDVRRPHVAHVRPAEELTDWTVHWDGVADRRDGTDQVA